MPAEPIRVEPVPEPLVLAEPPKEETEEVETTSAPAFAPDDLSKLLLIADNIAGEDPEQALFLYQRIIENDPRHRRGKARTFVQREEERLKPERLKHMLAQVEDAMKAGAWKRAESIGRDMLALDGDNADAKRIVDLCVKNTECEPMYRLAIIAAHAGLWGVVAASMRDIAIACPYYGDPASLLLKLPGLLRGWTILAGLTDHLCELATLQGHREPVSHVAFSPDGSLLASASADGTVKLWGLG